MRNYTKGNVVDCRPEALRRKFGLKPTEHGGSSKGQGMPPKRGVNRGLNLSKNNGGLVSEYYDVMLENEIGWIFRDMPVKMEGLYKNDLVPYLIVLLNKEYHEGFLEANAESSDIQTVTTAEVIMDEAFCRMLVYDAILCLGDALRKYGFTEYKRSLLVCAGKGKRIKLYINLNGKPLSQPKNGESTGEYIDLTNVYAMLAANRDRYNALANGLVATIAVAVENEVPEAARLTMGGLS